MQGMEHRPNAKCLLNSIAGMQGMGHRPNALIASTNSSGPDPSSVSPHVSKISKHGRQISAVRISSRHAKEHPRGSSSGKLHRRNSCTRRPPNGCCESTPTKPQRDDIATHLGGLQSQLRDVVPNFLSDHLGSEGSSYGRTYAGSIAYYVSRHCPNLRELDVHTCGADYDIEQEAHIALLLNCPRLEAFDMMSLRLDQDLNNCSEALLAGRAFQMQRITFEEDPSKALEMRPETTLSTWPNLFILNLVLMEEGQFAYLSKLLRDMPKLEELNISIAHDDSESSCLFGLKLEDLPQSVKTMSIDSYLDKGVPLVVDQGAAMNALPNLRSLRDNLHLPRQLPLLSKALAAMANLQELTISCGRIYHSKEGENRNGMESLTGLCPTNLPPSLRSLTLTCNQVEVAPVWFHNILSLNLSQMPLLERISIQFERLECDEHGTFSFRMLVMPIQDTLPHDLEVFLSRHDGIDVEVVGKTGTHRVIATHPEYKEVRIGREAITFYLRMYRGAGPFA